MTICFQASLSHRILPEFKELWQWLSCLKELICHKLPWGGSKELPSCPRGHVNQGHQFKRGSGRSGLPQGCAKDAAIPDSLRLSPKWGDLGLRQRPVMKKSSAQAIGWKWGAEVRKVSRVCGSRVTALCCSGMAGHQGAPASAEPFAFIYSSLGPLP